MAYTRTDPGAGNPGAIIEAGYQRGSRAFEIRETVLRSLFTARTRIEGSAWQGHGAAAYQASLDAVMTQIAPLASQLDAESFALRKYGNQVEAIAEKAATLRRRIKAVDEELITLNLKSMVPAALRGGTPTDSAGDELARAALAARRHDVASQKTALDAEWDVLFNDRVAADNECVAALTGGRVLGGISAFSAGRLAAVDAPSLLALLSDLTAPEITALFAVHPELGETLQKASADDVADWWFGYSDAAEPLSPTAEQLALIAAAPTVLGNLDGVAYWARDKANRIVLDLHINDARAMGSFNIDSLVAIRESLGRDESKPPRQLISLSDLGMLKPLAAVSVGDLDRALFTQVQVSGMYSSTKTMYHAVSDSLDMHKEMVAQASRFGVSGPIAVVAWIGYDSPSTAGVTHMDSAKDGARKLTDALLGYQAATRFTSPDSFVSVAAHSYGTTTAMLALSKNDLGVGALGMYGSAGAPPGVDNANDLKVPAAQVFAGENWDDPFAHIPRDIGFPAREDPRSFPGVTTFETDWSDADLNPPTPRENIHGHGEYLAPHSQSQRNLALIALGLGDKVSKARD